MSQRRRASPRAQARAILQAAMTDSLDAPVAVQESVAAQESAGFDPATSYDPASTDPIRTNPAHADPARTGSTGTESKSTDPTQSISSQPAPSLTERVRALFEDSALPVAEIARLVGVTERTIYKYARRHEWRPRYRWVNGKPGERHRRWQAGPEFAPAKGAGGRFVPRAEAGKPYPVGLKATDPAGAAQAVSACARAGALSQAALRRVERERQRERHGEACIGALVSLNGALAQWRTREPERAAAGRAAGPLSRALLAGVVLALRRWESAMDNLAG